MSVEDGGLLERYARSGHKSVEGWLGEDTIRNVLRIAGIQDEVIGIGWGVGEIGVHHGKLFILLYLLARADERGVAVDLFEEQGLNVDRSGHGDRAVFQANLDHHAAGGQRVEIITGDSTAIGGKDLRNAVGEALRLLSIDGGHLAHIVRHDLLTARDAICDGGVIILDDYFNPEFPGVSEGTAAFFLSGESGDIVPFLIAANKVYLTTKSHAERYLDRFVRTDLGVPSTDLRPFRFHQGPTCPIILTEFFGARVLSYSPDKYEISHRLRRRITRARRAARARLGEIAHWDAMKGSALGRALRKVADRVLPY
jgi:hypothetical protein